MRFRKSSFSVHAVQCTECSAVQCSAMQCRQPAVSAAGANRSHKKLTNDVGGAFCVLYTPLPNTLVAPQPPPLARCLKLQNAHPPDIVWWSVVGGRELTLCLSRGDASGHDEGGYTQ